LNWKFLALLAVYCVGLISKWAPYLREEGQSSEHYEESINITFIRQYRNTTIISEEYANYSSQLETALKNASEEMNILFWYKPFGSEVMVQRRNNLERERCGNCKVIFDRDKIAESSTKAVVFHFKELQDSVRYNVQSWFLRFFGSPSFRGNLEVLNKKRSDQLYIWWTLEGPASLRDRGIKLTEFDDIFHLTMTYRQDSGIYQPYNTAYEVFNKKKTTNFDGEIDSLIRNKTNLALWIVSNDWLPGAKRRKKLADQLMKAGLDLDARGRLFPDAPKVPSDTEEDFIDFIRGYKFYLSFENQYHCKDYFTEKLWHHGYLAETVPIVWGGVRDDYKSVLPPNSYIFAEDYTAEGLVDYIQYLDNNDTAYKEYFKWRDLEQYQIPQYNRATGLCQICRMIYGINIDNIYSPLHNDKASNFVPYSNGPIVPQTIHSLRHEIFDKEYTECH